MSCQTGDEVIVHPKIGRLLPAWKRRERELAESISRANARLGLFDDEFHGIREYRSGDNPRAIHWRSSARHGHFMVKEHEQHREADLIVLLDLCSSTDVFGIAAGTLQSAWPRRSALNRLVRRHRAAID